MNIADEYVSTGNLLLAHFCVEAMLREVCRSLDPMRLPPELPDKLPVKTMVVFTEQLDWGAGPE